MGESAAKRILIVGPAWIGDMVMAQSLFKLLKLQQPKLILDVLAPAWSHSLLARMPEVNEALVLPFAHNELSLKKRFQLARSLKERHYQQAILLPNSFKSALIPWWAKIPKRTGWLGEYRFALLNDIRYLDKKRLPLMVERFMSLAFTREDASKFQKNLNLEKFFPNLSILKTGLEQSLQHFQLKPGKILGLCPGAEFGPSKRWPSEHYAELANRKLAEGWQVWIFGSEKDSAVATEINKATQNRCVNLAGKTSLTEAIDLLSAVKAVVTNDSGLMHIAAALKRPLIALYGSSSPQFTPPLAKQVKILSLNLACSPCFERECPLGHHLCMKNLSVNRVLEALESFGSL